MFKYKENTQGIFSLIGDGLELYKTSFTKVFLWTFLFHFILQGLIHLQGSPKTFSSTDVYLMILTFLVPLILAPAFSIIIFALMHNTAWQSDKTIAITALVRQFYWRVIGADLLYTLFFILGVAAFAVVGFVLMFFTHHHLLLLIIFGLLLFIALVSIFPYLLFYKPLILFDDLTIMKSIKTSFKLVQSHWWHTALVVIVPGIILGVINVTISIFAGKHLAGFVIDVVVSAILMPITFALTLVLFNDLKIRKKDLFAPNV